MKRRFCVLVLLNFVFLGAAEAAAQEPVPVLFGGLKIYPALDVREEYNSNVFSADTTSAKTSSLISTISPSLEIGTHTDSSDVSVHYQFDKTMHKSVSKADTTSQSIALDGAFKLSKRLNTRGYVDYKKTNELKTVDQVLGAPAIVLPDKLTTSSLEGEVSYGIRGIIALSGGLSTKRYDDLNRGKDGDVDTMKAGFALSFPVRTKGRALFEARYISNNFIYALNKLDNTGQAYYLGLDWDNKSKTTGRLRLGYSSTSYKQIAGGGIFSWELGASWLPRSDSTLSINSSNTAVGSEAEFGYTVSNANSLSWDHVWSGALKHSTSIGYDITKYNSTAVAGFTNFSHKETMWHASVGLDYKVRRWLRIGGGYNFSNRTSDLAVGGVAKPVYRQHIFSLDLTGTM